MEDIDASDSTGLYNGTGINSREVLKFRDIRIINSFVPLVHLIIHTLELLRLKAREQDFKVDVSL